MKYQFVVKEKAYIINNKITNMYIDFVIFISDEKKMQQVGIVMISNTLLFT